MWCVGKALCAMVYLASVVPAVVEARAHHIFRYLQLNDVCQLGVELVAHGIVHDGHLHVTHDAGNTTLETLPSE